MGQIGIGYHGVDNIKTTTETDNEIIPSKINTRNGLKQNPIFYKFSFHNFDECTIKINGSEPIKLLAEQGFETDQVDSPINTFIITDTNIRYQWVGHYY